jgi:hypothetical protein
MSSWCVCCSSRTQERARALEASAGRSAKEYRVQQVTSPMWMRCSGCSSIWCGDGAMLFRQRMELEGITEIDFPWLAEVKKFLASPSIGETVVPPEISPCCHLSNLLHPQSKGQSSEKRKWVSLDFDDCPVDGCRVVECRLDDSQEKCNNGVSSSRRKKTTERSKKKWKGQRNKLFVMVVFLFPIIV